MENTNLSSQSVVAPSPESISKGVLESPGDEPTAGDLMDSVRSALAASAMETVFTLDGTLELGGHPIVIRWDGNVPNSGHSVALPLPIGDSNSENAFKQLLDNCQPATFGRKQEEVLDEEYRKAGKMDSSSFSTNFHPSEHGVIDEIAQAFAIRRTAPRGITAELYKLNVYSAPSGKFMAHVDTPRSEAQMGSLVVCLPYPHKGGQLAVRHQGREVVYGWAAESTTDRIQWAAFFSDCEHEVFEVSEGHRVTLTYNLYWAAPPVANHVLMEAPQSMAFFNALQSLLRCPDFFPNGGMLGYACVHAYAHTSQSITADGLRDGLKGSDVIVYNAFERLLGSASITAMLEDSFDADSDSYADEAEEPNRRMEFTEEAGSQNEPVRENRLEDSTSGDHSTEEATQVESPSKFEIAIAVLSEGMDADSETSAVATTNASSSTNESIADRPDVDRVYLSENFRGPTMVLDGEWGEFGQAPFDPEFIGFRRRDVVWINHAPDALGTGDRGRELAAVYFVYGNEPGPEACYSYVVIVGEVGPFEKRGGESIS